MQYAEIMLEITSKLTGDYRKDGPFLIDESNKYVDHPYSTEILREIGRMLYGLLPEEERNKYEDVFRNNHIFSDTILNEAKDLIRCRHIAKAKKMLEFILPDDKEFIEDSISVYGAFNNLLEEVCYREIINPEKELRIVSAHCLEIFLTYAYVLVEEKDYDSAIKVLNRAISLNPFDLKLLFEKEAILKIKKDWKECKEISNWCLEYAYSSTDLARAYRNYGYVFIEEMNFDAAIVCYLTSIMIQEELMAKAQLYMITQMTQKVVDTKHYSENAKSILDANNIQFGPNPAIVDLCYNLALLMEKEDQAGQALWLYKILYDLTKHDEILTKIKSLEKCVSN